MDRRKCRNIYYHWCSWGIFQKGWNLPLRLRACPRQILNRKVSRCTGWVCTDGMDLDFFLVWRSHQPIDLTILTLSHLCAQNYGSKHLCFRDWFSASANWWWVTRLSDWYSLVTGSAGMTATRSFQLAINFVLFITISLFSVKTTVVF